MSGKDDATASDSDLFRQAMSEKGVVREQYDLGRVNHPPDRRPPGPIINARHPAEPLAPPGVDQTDSDTVLFARQFVRKAELKRLRRGQFTLDETIDLHGMRSAEAERALQQFLAECLSYNYGTVLIVHGKGQQSDTPGGVLKPLTLHWLRQQPSVSAFCTALPGDGGQGAVYVLLGSS